MAKKRTRRLSQVLQRQAQQSNRHLLAGSKQNILFALVGKFGDLMRQRDETVGLARHRGNHNNDIFAGDFGGSHFLRHVFNALDRADRGTPVFLYQ